MAHRSPSFGRLFAIVVGVGGGALLAGCGGGGSGGGVDRPAAGFQLGTVPTVQRLETPLGLAGSRGSGADVFVSFNLRDREYNPASIQLEYGYDVNGDGRIDGSEGEPSIDDEYFTCTPAPGGSTNLIGLDTATGKGADHLFIWASGQDTAGARFVTQDYSYTPQGRPIIGTDGQPVFGNTPGIQLRMRANDNDGATNRWGAWKTTKAFDLNNNSQPAITIEPVGLNGVTANPTGTAADTDVVLNFRIIDADAATVADPNAVAVDFAAVPPGTDLNDAAQVAALNWLPASTASGTPDTGLPSSTVPGALNTWTWDSRTDVGTVNGDFILRITPFDSKLERGATVMMPERFRLDNYTIFTDAGSALSAPRIGHRATTLATGNVLITGGRTTAAGASVSTAELFYPGIGETTYGAVAATGSLNTARSFHSQTRLLDDRVLVAGGYDASGNPLSSMEIYNPATGTWTTLGVTLGTARARHTAVLLANGDVLLAGGVDASTALASAAIYHFDTGTVTTVGSLVAARHSAAGALLPDGTVLIPGGKTFAGSALASVEIYDPMAETFSAGPAMSSARAEHAVAAMTDGRVLVSGGVGLNTVSIYDAESGSWDNTAPAMSSVRAGHVGILMGDGSILLAGGSDGSSVGSSANIFAPSSGTYDSPNSGMVEARRDAATVVLNNGRVLIVGGLDDAGAPLASLEIYTPDGGFNYLPSAKITTPAEPQSWAFGALLSYRLLDAEMDPAKLIFQYSISGGAWQTCTSKGGPWDDGGADTIAGDVNEGLVDLETVDADSVLPIDPILKNTVGDHLFVWDMSSDITRADYPSVRVRILPLGAGRGAMATSNPFAIAFNTRVIPRFAPFTGSVSGTVVIDYHLQDIDGPALPDPTGDGARVEFEYGIDTNGDKQILSPEVWKTCSRVPGTEDLGPGYTLATAKEFDPTIGTLGWHSFTWDSIRDIGSPVVGQTRTDLMLRCTPYDFPAGVDETKGRQETVGVDQGFTVILDPSGLYLVSWGTEGGQTYSGTALGNVKLDETLVFNFNREVDPATVDGIVGRTTLGISVAGRKILGTYQADPLDYKVVRFFPQLNNSANGSPVLNGTENPTILTRGVNVAITIPAYIPGGASPETADILRIRNFVPGDPAVGIVNLLAFNYSPALTTSSAAGTAAYFVRGVAPTVNTAVPLHMATGQTLTQGFNIEFDGQLNGETLTIAAAKIVVDLNGNGVADANDSIIPGSFTVTNTAGAAGTRKSILSFTPLGGVNYPAGSQILAYFAGATAGDGTVAKGPGGGSPAVWFSTVAGATTTTTFTESFNDQVNMEAAETNALWNNTALGFGGILTGLRDGGTGADGTPTATLVGNVRTFSAKDTWNFTSFTIPKNEIWRFTGGGGNLPVKILVTGDIDIAGVVDVSGGDGQGSYPQESTTTTSYPYHKRYSGSVPSAGTLIFTGGTGIAGGGNGGNAYLKAAGQTGIPGYGASAANSGGGAGLVTYGTGGGGAGHAQSGSVGGQYASGYGSVGTSGTSYGTSDFSGGQTAGSGGGSGSAYNTYYSYSENSVTYYYHMLPGSAGAGGGAVKLVANGSFTVRGSGLIDASGGNGGNGWAYYFGGSGGAGSGGSVWIVSGGNLNIGGVIDVRGGRGGDFENYNNAYAQGSPARYGTFGGHASAGRVRIEGPNVSTTQTRFIGGTHYNTISSGALNGGSGTLGSFPSGTTINIDSIPKDGSGFMNFSTMSIPSGTTVTLTGASAAKMRFTGNVSISGVLRSSGGVGANGIYTGGQYSTFSVITGGAGGAGGGKGGIPNSTSSTTLTDGGAGAGTGGGKGGLKSSGAFPYSWAAYYYGGSGGGGGSNLLNMPGRDGKQCTYAAGYYGTKAGGGAGAGYTDPGAMTLSNLTGGSGGGSGANAQYVSSSVWYYNYGAGAGGGGGGGIGIETAGSFTMGSAGRIEVLGGKGGFGYTNIGGGGGGGGSGGNVLVRANSLSFTTGAIIDTTPGAGEKCYNSVNYNYGNNGGDGGYGGIRIETVSESGTFLNIGNLFGYTTSTGSLTTATYVTGDTGTTKWQTALGVAPDFHTAGIATPINLSGNVDVTIQGAMMDPVTGARSTTLTGSQLVSTTPLSQGLGSPNAIDGFKFWRVVFKLKPPSSPTFTVPTVFDASLKVDTK